MEQVKSKRLHLRRIAIGVPAVTVMLLAGIAIHVMKSRGPIYGHLPLVGLLGARRKDWLRDILRSQDLLVLIGLALFMPLVLNIPVLAIRVVLGLGMTLVAPGYALTSALFPRHNDLDIPARAALSVGLSIALVPALTLLLSKLPWGIHTTSIAVAISVWIVALSLLAIERRLPLAESGESFAPFEIIPLSRRSNWKHQLHNRYALGCAVLTITLIVGMGTWLGGDSGGRPTEFYLLGAAGQAEEYPRQTTTHEKVSVTIGIMNGATNQQTYRVEIWAMDAFVEDTSTLVQHEGPIVLDPEERAEWHVSWQMPRPGTDQRVQLLLFAGRNEEPLRRLELWLDVIDS